MEDKFETEIDRLAALQAIDRVVREKQGQIAVLSNEVAGLEEELRRHRDECARLSAEQSALETQRAHFEARLQAEETKIKGSRMRMTRIRNERELLAMQHEINVSKEANQQLEEQLLGVMEQVENVSGQLQALQDSLSGLEEQAIAEIRARREQIEALDREMNADLSRRSLLVEGMNSSLRGKYEQIFARRGGTAVVEVKNGTCQGCHMHVPPQLFNELQKFRDIRQCPNCHRILYWRPEIEPAA